MTRKSRITSFLLAALLVVGAVVLGIAPRQLFAQGSQVSSTPGEPPAATEPPDTSDGGRGEPFTGGLEVLEADLVAAVALATDVPASWEYDPDARLIFPEDARIDYPVQIPEPEWRELLGPNEYYILRQKGTEPAFSHPLNDNKRRGIYYSRATGQPLFSSEDKYDSRSGWPSFTRPINAHAIVYLEDNSLFMRRIEVVDSLSGSHLGHVFWDGPAPTGQRYCINGAALVFVPEGEEPPPIRRGLE
ncbi:MAG: peptide-methionine (R)-S-oxide reductase MsrB [Spirochaetota bacterium]